MSEHKNVVSRMNPVGMAAPVGRYSHVTKIDRNAELYTFSGQIGIDMDGHIPDDLNTQIAYTFVNIAEILTSQQIGADNVIKVNIWATEEIDWDVFYPIWDSFFGNNPPSMTVAYISALGLPELKIEIEIWAAK